MLLNKVRKAELAQQCLNGLLMFFFVFEKILSNFSQAQCKKVCLVCLSSNGFKRGQTFINCLKCFTNNVRSFSKSLKVQSKTGVQQYMIHFQLKTLNYSPQIRFYQQLQSFFPISPYPKNKKNSFKFKFVYTLLVLSIGLHSHLTSITRTPNPRPI